MEAVVSGPLGPSDLAQPFDSDSGTLSSTSIGAAEADFKTILDLR